MSDQLNQAKKMLTSLFDRLDGMKMLDVDGDALNFTVTLPNKKQYVINFHALTEQIWVSSPLSGAHHFAFKDHMWNSTRDDTLLPLLIATEIPKAIQS
jgi:frataxin